MVKQMIVTYEQLKDLGACEDQLEVFKATFGESVVVNEESVQRAVDACLDLWWALKNLPDQTPDICLAAVSQNGFALYYVKDQTSDICLAAVNQNGWALEFVKDQTPEICLAAVEQDDRALRYVKKKTPKICFAAGRQCGRAFWYGKARSMLKQKGSSK